jgi:putative membrane-bound dehydrogenase-like protein
MIVNRVRNTQLCGAALVLVLLASGAAAAPAPKVPPGWSIELVAEAPRIKHPTMMVVTPDGRLLVGEDPMDISLPAHVAKGRILAFHPDGHVSVFAEGLHAVFGLLYLEGKVIVHHSPRLTVFRDGGERGLDPIDLVPVTNPRPWVSDWNDHVPANLRLAMDGYLYLSVGDKGVYGAEGKDKSRAELRGGGLLRLRPDGTGLEVFSTGTRNHLDVAIDAEDELFTYDNTDEKNGWWSRVTHHVDGGDYGYPWHWKPQAPFTLPPMIDYGGGAPCAAFAYLEDAWPKSLRGNLFLADFGKRLVHRLVVERAGATFRVTERQDLIIDPPGDFRPVGLALTPDGRSIYVGDWAHRDIKVQAVAGRLWKLTRSGPSEAAPKPAWFLPAALGKALSPTVTPTVAALGAALGHPSGSVRLLAQRLLGRRGSEAVPVLEKIVREGSEPAAWHALWALDGGGATGFDGGRATILGAVDAPSPRLRRQAIRQLGTRRVGGAAPAIAAHLHDPEPSVRLAAASALGRIGRPEDVAALQAALLDADRGVRFAAFTALGRIGRARPEAWPAIVGGLRHPDERVRAGTAYALRDVHDVRLLAALGAAQGSATSRAAALDLVAALAQREPAWKGDWWGVFPLSDYKRPAPVAWEGTAGARSTLREALGDREPIVRRAAIAGLGAAGVGEPADALALRDLWRRERDVEVRRALLGALGRLGPVGDTRTSALVASVLQDVRSPLLGAAIEAAAALASPGEAPGPLPSALASVAGNPRAGVESRRAALRAIGGLRARSVVPALGRLLAPRPARGTAADPALSLEAVVALGAIGGPAATRLLSPQVEHADAQVAAAAVAALGRGKSTDAVPALLVAFGRPTLRPDAIAALARLPDGRAVEAYLAGLGSADQRLRDACAKALAAVKDAARPAVDAHLGRRDLSSLVVAGLRRIYGDAVVSGVAAADDAFEPEAYARFVQERGGDPERGKALFHDERGVACVRCHKVAGRGGDAGPELTTIGAQFARRELADSVLFPSKAVREGYQQVIVKIRTGGHELAGFERGETPDQLFLQDGDGQRHEIQKSEIVWRKPSDVSLMPDGLYAALSLQDFADLVSYLESLRAAGAAQATGAGK